MAKISHSFEKAHSVGRFANFEFAGVSKKGSYLERIL